MKTYGDFGNRIKECRVNNNLTQAALAKILDIDAQTVSRWECNERKPGRSKIEKMATFFNVSADYLLGLRDSPEIRPVDKHLEKEHDIQYVLSSIVDEYDTTWGDLYDIAKTSYKENDPVSYAQEVETESSNAHNIDNVEQVPIIDGIISVSAGEGNGFPNITWNEIGKMPIPKDDLIGYSWQGAQYCIISVDGDSMEPYICNGDRLLFASGIDVGPGEVAVVSYNDVLWVKGVLKNKDGTVTLISFNKNYPDRIIDPQQHAFYILGKALRVVSSKKIPSTI